MIRPGQRRELVTLVYLCGYPQCGRNWTVTGFTPQHCDDLIREQHDVIRSGEYGYCCGSHLQTQEAGLIIGVRRDPPKSEG